MLRFATQGKEIWKDGARADERLKGSGITPASPPEPNVGPQGRMSVAWRSHEVRMGVA